MQIILSDHNCEGHSKAIFVALKREGWLDLIPMELKWFEHVGLSPKADDETVWRFCQEHGYLLLTGNRSTKDGNVSLELTIRRLITPESLPVLTIGNLKRVLRRPEYCQQCADKLAEIVLVLEKHRGMTRLYLPGQA